MLRPKSPQNSFYGSYLYDRIIPQNHLLRKINSVVDFSFVNELVKDRYNPDFGRPAEDPEFMLRLCLLQYLYGDSDRHVIDNAKMNLGYKFFLGLAIDEEVPDDTAGGYYGRLYQIMTANQTLTLQHVTHNWDAGGNLIQRYDSLASQTEAFSYDFLDRLTGVTGAYSESYSYNALGNILSKEGNSYTYGTKPHAVTQVGTTNYTYDANGNMLTRGNQNLTWDVENRAISVTGGSAFIYDGDGNRAKKVENGNTTVYINKYYEKNLTTNETTTNYYFGDRFVALKKGSTLTYIQQDHLTGTSITTNSNGVKTNDIKYYPYGDCRNSPQNLATDKLFTGQRLDSTGLYYYKSPSNSTSAANPSQVANSALTVSGLWSGRYYDPSIGRFIQPDTIIPDQKNPQSLNRYSYVKNNPLKYKDPDGHVAILATAAIAGVVIGAINAVHYVAVHPSDYTNSGIAIAAGVGFAAGFLGTLGGAELAAGFGVVGGSTVAGGIFGSTVTTTISSICQTGLTNSLVGDEVTTGDVGTSLASGLASGVVGGSFSDPGTIQETFAQQISTGAIGEVVNIVSSGLQSLLEPVPGE